MRVTIEQSVFQQGTTRTLALLELLALGWDERHAILTTPLFQATANQPVNIWLNTLKNSKLQKEIEFILDQSIPLASRLHPQAAKIRVVTGGSDWNRGRVELEDAVRLLKTPLKLLLENRRNDYKFLLRLAPPTFRQDLEDSVRKGWIEPEQAGGLGEMKTLLQDLATAPSTDIASQIHRLRLWVMFDRDSDPRDRSKPSKASEDVHTICSSAVMQNPWPFQYFQLRRRSIENYLPDQALKHWQGEAQGPEMAERRRKVAALIALTKHNPQARWQYNMKHGLMGDLPNKTVTEIKEQGRDIRDSDLDSLFKGLTDDVRKDLTDGFGKDIADLYSQFQQAWESFFQAEYSQGPTGQPTRNDLLSLLFSRM